MGKLRREYDLGYVCSGRDLFAETGKTKAASLEVLIIPDGPVSLKPTFVLSS